MMQLLRISGLSLLISVAVSTKVIAQKTYALGVGGGAAIPAGKLSDVQKTGYHGLAVFAIGLADLPIGVRIDGIYNKFRHSNVLSVQAGFPSSSNLRIMGVLVNLVYAFPGSTSKPYVVVGGGLYNLKADAAGARAENNFGFNAGLGATFGIGPFAAFLESRYHTISRTAAKGGVVQFVPITLGVIF
jgi:Outer membrane protein beta-barrel domain